MSSKTKGVQTDSFFIFAFFPRCTRTLHPARPKGADRGAEFQKKFCRREPQGSKFVAWFDVQKRASSLGGAKTKKPEAIASGLLFCLFPRCTRTLHPARPSGADRGELCDRVANSRRKALALSLVAWFDVQKRASTLGGAKTKSPRQSPRVFCFAFSPSCTRTLHPARPSGADKADGTWILMLALQIKNEPFLRFVFIIFKIFSKRLELNLTCQKRCDIIESLK